jgi:hypothetical protein
MNRRLRANFRQIKRGQKAMEKFSPSETIIKLTQAATGYATAKARVKCGGLSTPQRTMRLSVVPVEMTRFVGVERQLHVQRQKQAPTDDKPEKQRQQRQKQRRSFDSDAQNARVSAQDDTFLRGLWVAGLDMSMTFHHLPKKPRP